MISYYKSHFLEHSQIPINDNLFQGIGIFETIKFINRKIIFFDDHINRLFSNSFFNFDNFSKDEIYNNIQSTIDKNDLESGLIKIIAIPIDDNFKNLEYYIFLRESPQINDWPVKIKFYSESNYPLLRFNPAYKSLFYMGNILASKDAKESGAFEPIFYNKNYIITEGAIRNIFFIKNNTLYAPSINLGILAGITRNKVLEIAKKLNYTISETNIQYSDIHNMNEAFLTSTAIGVMPCYWDGWKSDYSLTLTLKNHYNKMVKIK